MKETTCEHECTKYMRKYCGHTITVVNSEDDSVNEMIVHCTRVKNHDGKHSHCVKNNNGRYSHDKWTW